MLCTPKLAFAPTLLLWSVVQWSSAVGRSKNLEEGASRSSRFFKLGIRICLLIFLPKLGGGGIYLSSCPHGSDGPVMYSCSFPSCWPISFDSLLRKHGYNGTHSLTFIWNSGVFFSTDNTGRRCAKDFFLQDNCSCGFLFCQFNCGLSAWTNHKNIMFVNKDYWFTMG